MRLADKLVARQEREQTPVCSAPCCAEDISARSSAIKNPKQGLAPRHAVAPGEEIRVTKRMREVDLQWHSRTTPTLAPGPSSAAFPIAPFKAFPSNKDEGGGGVIR